MFISEDTVKEVKSYARIYDVVSDYVSLRKKGKDYFGRCPFHKEKTASFSVSPESNLYYCFGCHVGGDSIKFIQDFDKCNFTEAIVTIANKMGVQIKLSEPEKQAEYEQKKSEEAKILEIISISAIFYNYQLKQNFSKVQLFLDSRGFDNANIVEDFLIGYATNHKDSLYQYLLERFPEYNHLFIKTGLFKDSPTGLTDFFRNRIIIPIRDSQGRIIAFGGRSLDDKQPKYLNSPETILFNKSQVLFGLDAAKDSVKKTKTHDGIILVEGYFDVIALHGIGFTNAVACLGTAVSDYQVKQLLKVSNKLYLCFDSDNPGLEATNKTIKSLEFEIKNNLIDLKIISIPDKDPLDFVLRNGSKSSKEFEKSINCSKNWIDWLVDVKVKNCDLSDKSQWKKLFNYLIEIVNKIDDIDKIRYVQSFSEILSKGDINVKSDIYKLFVNRLNKVDDNVVDFNKIKNKKIENINLINHSESIILKIYLHNTHLRKLIIDILAEKNIDFCLQNNRNLWLEIRTIEPECDDKNIFKPRNDLLDVIRINHSEDSVYSDYFYLTENEKNTINTSPSKVVLIAVAHLEIKMLETKLKYSFQKWKDTKDDKYLEIYKEYYEQLKIANKNQLKLGV